MPELLSQSQTENVSKINPHEVVATFFQEYTLPECQGLIWELLAASFSSEDSDLWDKYKRGNAVFFFRNVGKLIQALWEINQNPQVGFIDSKKPD
jgi:hypothetical protein